MPHDGQDASRSSWIALSIEAITRLACRWPKATLWLILASTIGCSLLAWQTLTIKTKRGDLISAEAPYQKRWQRYADAFEDVTEDLVVVVEGRNRRAIIRTISDLGPRVERESKYFRNVLYQIDLRNLLTKGLQFLSTEELEQLAVKLKKFRLIAAVAPRAAEQAQAAAPQVDLAAQIDQLVAAWKNWAHLPPEQQAALSQQTIELLSGLTSAEPVEPEAAGVASAATQPAALQEPIRYLLNDEGTMGFIQAQPVVEPGDLNGATESVEKMKKLIAAVQKRHPEARIGLTGVPALEFDEMRVSQSEMAEASVLSFVGVALVLFAGFRRLRHPFLATLMLLVGTAWSFAAAALAVGHLNILSIAFAAMLFGLGNDFAIVYLSHYSDQRDRGLSLYEAILDASRSVGPGITTAAFTAAAAFFAAVLTDFAGIAELGLIAGWGILLCNLLTFLFIPPALVVWDRNWDVAPAATPRPLLFGGRWIGASSLVGFLVALGFLAWHAPLVRYNTNLLDMQAAGTEPMRVQKRIEEKSESSLLYGVSLAKDRKSALALRDQFEELPSVGRVDEIASMFPPAATKKRKELIDSIARAATALSTLATSVPDPSRIGTSLDELYSQLDAANVPELKSLVGQLDQFLDRLSSLSLADQIKTLNPARAIPAAMASLVKNVSTDPVTLADLPSAFTSRFVSPDGHWLLKIYPKESVWDGPPLQAFVEDLRAVDPEVTGTPLQNYEASKAIWDSYLQAGLYALVAVLVLLWWDFRTIHETLLAISPAACGLLATLGVLGWWNIPLNPANMIMLPLLLGLGVDGGVHVIHDYRAQSDGYRMSSSTVRAILLTASTSIVGFGSLMIASHRGLFSLGFVLTVGVSAAMVTSLVALPSLLSLVAPGAPAAETAGLGSGDPSTDNEGEADRSAA